jgi:hypothetical protein
MTRRRARGGGRKPFGATAARPMSIRIDDELRAQLEAAARKNAKQNPTWNVSREMVRRLRQSFRRERDDHRDRAMRAICHLVAETGRRGLRTDDPLEGYGWHRDPFKFKTFKLAIAKLLDAIEPPGEVRMPPECAGLYDSLGPIDTPERLANYIASEMRNWLFHHRTSMPGDERAELLKLVETSPYRGTDYDLIALIHAIDDEHGTISQLRRDLGIDEPKEGQS